MKLLRLLFSFSIAFGLAVTTFAQTSGTISGTVTDASGGVIPNAKVAARNLTNGERRDTVTNANGQYAFPSVPPGEYEIEIEQAGFAVTRRKATLSITERIAVDFALQPSTVKEQIEINSAAPLLQTETAALGRVVEGNAVKELPLSSRNFTQLPALSPGTSGPLNDAGALGRGTQNI